MAFIVRKCIRCGVEAGGAFVGCITGAADHIFIDSLVMDVPHSADPGLVDVKLKRELDRLMGIPVTKGMTLDVDTYKRAVEHLDTHRPTVDAAKAAEYTRMLDDAAKDAERDASGKEVPIDFESIERSISESPAEKDVREWLADLLADESVVKSVMSRVGDATKTAFEAGRACEAVKSAFDTSLKPADRSKSAYENLAYTERMAALGHSTAQLSSVVMNILYDGQDDVRQQSLEEGIGHFLACVRLMWNSTDIDLAKVDKYADEEYALMRGAMKYQE